MSTLPHQLAPSPPTRTRVSGCEASLLPAGTALRIWPSPVLEPSTHHSVRDSSPSCPRPSDPSHPGFRSTPTRGSFQNSHCWKRRCVVGFRFTLSGRFRLGSENMMDFIPCFIWGQEISGSPQCLMTMLAFPNTPLSFASGLSILSPRTTVILGFMGLNHMP